MPSTEPDLKRLGIFREQSYVTIGTPYVPPRQAVILKGDSKSNENLRPLYLAGGYSKTRAAVKDGYFSEYQRIFDGEEYVNIIALRRRWRNSAKAKNVDNKQWVPNSPGGKPSGVGSALGLFGPPISALDPNATKKPHVPEKPNFYTNPGKHGTGYGYLDITIGKYPEWQAGATSDMSMANVMRIARLHHLDKLKGRGEFYSTTKPGELFDPNPYQYGDPLAPGGPPVQPFDINPDKKKMIGPVFKVSSPAKWDGGCKAGTLNPWPEYSAETFIDSSVLLRRLYNRGSGKLPEGTKIWLPNSDCALVMPNPSILNHVVKIGINGHNRKKIMSLWDKKPVKKYHL